MIIKRNSHTKYFLGIYQLLIGFQFPHISIFFVKISNLEFRNLPKSNLKTVIF